MHLGKENATDFLDTVYGAVMPTGRVDLLAEWKSDPQALLDRARESDMPTDGYCNARAAPTPESPGSAVDFLLYNSGVRMVDTFNVPSSKMDDLPDIIPEQGEKVEPLAQMMNAYWDEAYYRTLMTGQKAATSLAPIESNTIWRQIREERPFREPAIDPAFNFMELLAFSRRIREDQYRLNKWKNASKEQMMQELAEGTEPRLFEIERDKKVFEMTDYRAGIEATDSFLNDPQVRASDITEAVESIAIGHRIILLRKACKTIVDACPTGNVFNAKTGPPANPYLDVTYKQGRMDWPRYTLFRTKSGTAYTFDCAIGNEPSILSLDNMSISDGANITFGSWATAQGSNVRKFNGNGMSLGYGWVDKDAETGFSDNKLWFFQKMSTLGFVQRMGMDQDELERVPGPRKVRRWLGTSSLFCDIDTNGIWQYDMSDAT